MNSVFNIISETEQKMASTTQNIIDDLYVNFKDIFIAPAISTNMYKEIEKKNNRPAKKSRQRQKNMVFERM